MKRILIAIVLLSGTFVLHAQTSEELYQEGMKLIDDEKYEEAAAKFKDAVSKDKQNENAIYEAAWCLNEIGEYAEAITYTDMYEPADKYEKSKKYCERGYAYYKLESQDNAVQAYETALEAVPDDGTALRGIGDVYYNSDDDYEKAIEYYEKAIELDEDNSKGCYFKLGWLYNDMTEYDDAINVLLKAINYDDEDADAYRELGYAYYQKGENNSAIYQLEKNIKLDPESKFGHYYLGLVYIATGEKEKAREMYAKLKSIDEDQAEKLKAEIDKN